MMNMIIEISWISQTTALPLFYGAAVLNHISAMQSQHSFIASGHNNLTELQFQAT
jgi:hypothetical protein